jgi:hypothetical protein
MPDHGDGDERIAEDPSHHSPTDAEFRQPTAMVNHMEKHKPALSHEPLLNYAAVLGLADRLLCQFHNFGNACSAHAVAEPVEHHIKSRGRGHLQSHTLEYSILCCHSVAHPWPPAQRLNI